ncbi:PKD-like family lipoprotein [Chitinophaga sp. sic0106]|uniref:PKD-like family lipoprotein n=1 Tax=Chitinophaga sp. sic0106 TaxID=2854785 RepID=UPI001C482D6C|nr:PKD-like family lipoprotein [Chitinophaga sp. sic0106]MBV7531398.1 hypothetical protein [Chitinophaga sp. sic0106]
MKTNISLIYTLLLAMILTACVKDKSNDGFLDINTILISDSTAPKSLLQFDTLKINPAIAQLHGSGESDLAFEWSLHQNDVTDPYPIFILDSTRNLRKNIDVRPGIYRVVYKVTVKSTGVTYFHFFPLTVINRFSEGWLTLEEENGGGDLSIILPTDTVFHHIFSSINPEVNISNPVQVDVSNSYGVKKLYLFTKNNGLELDYTEMVKVSDYTSWFWETPVAFQPQLYKRISDGTSFIINNGLFNVRVEGGFPGDVKYMNALPYPDNKGDNYFLAPLVAVGPQPYTGGKSPYTAIIFDTRSKGFVYLSGASLVASFASFGAPAAGSAFDMRNIGMDMVSMDEGNVRFQHNAVFKDAGGEYYLYQFDANSNNASMSKQLITDDAPELKGAAKIVSSKTLQQMYFVNNGNIYLYDIPSGKARVIYTLAGGETVTYLTCTTKSLLVATWNGTAGKVYNHSISPLGDFAATKSFTGFGKIVSMVNKIP